MELVALGVEKLWDRLSQEYEQYKGVEDQVCELKTNLRLLKSFLKDADAKKHTNKMVQYCVEEIKEIVYDAEDIVETCILKEKVVKKRGIMNCFKGFASKVVDNKELASDIRGISTRILKVISDMKDFGVNMMIVDGSCSSHPLQEREREMQQEFARDYESDFVGLDASVKKLVGYLVKEDDIQMVSVTGMGGLGKTTLARHVFNHEEVKDHFEGFAWVCVSKDFTRKNVWQAIFRNLKPNEEEKNILEMTEATLVDKLSRLLETSRSLIVIDDIWKKEDWDLIKLIFPPKKGWAVLLTSRDESIIVNGGTTYINFKADCLNFDDSWTLFQRIAFPRKNTAEFEVDEEMEELGKQMIKHCGGLPLAIKVLGGLLAANYIVHEWQRLSANIGSHIVQITSGNKGSIDNVLSMSFEGLPSYLKQCFLYLAHFPEDYAVNVGKLSYHWAAEGIPKPSYYDGASIRDVGDIYVEELVRRNMVTAKRDSLTSRYETLQLHDMMREVCLLKAKEENFLHIAGSSSSTAADQSPHPSRRYVSQNPKYFHAETDITNPKLRSLVIVRNDIGNHHLRSCSSLTFSGIQLLRVLDLFATNFKGGRLPSDIGNLIHLRYLGLEKAWLCSIPSALQNLKLLIYLNLYIDKESLLVPNVLMGMRELRYLTLPSVLHDDTMLELSKMENLESMENFSTKHISLEDLHGMSGLRILSIILSDETSIETLSSSIGGMRHLEDLTIKTNGRTRRTRKEELRLGLVNLKHLILHIYIPRLPDQQHFPYRLIFLHLKDCGLEEDPMPILEKLLQLKEVTFGDKSFVGRKMVCSDGGFPKLQKLAFSWLEEWEDWIVKGSSMPLLHSLDISTCHKLKGIPNGLEFITLNIYECSELKELPGQQHFPSHLTTISIRGSSLRVNPMLILEKLLHVKKVCLHSASFSGRKMVSSAGGFPQLQELDLSNDCEEWVIEEGSMPLLHTLHIGGYHLPELPDGLRFLTSLKSLKCGLLGTGWRERVSKGGKDYYKVQHIPNVQIFGNEFMYDSDCSSDRHDRYS